MLGSGLDSGRRCCEGHPLSLALLRFAVGGTIHEHPADIDIDVICLEGHGMTSVGGIAAELHASEQVRWPAGLAHRLWTEDSGMLTLMVEYRPTLPEG